MALTDNGNKKHDQLNSYFVLNSELIIPRECIYYTPPASHHIIPFPRVRVTTTSWQLAVARMDEGKFKTKLEQENARHTDLSRSLEQAYTQMLEAGLNVGTSDAP